MINVVDHRSTDFAGPVFRRGTPGPEAELVSEFLARTPFAIPRGCRATLFCEPHIASGFPDLVLVVWNVAVAQKWKPARASLSRDDVRLLHFLHGAGAQTDGVLRSFFPRSLMARLERLEEAELIYQSGHYWRPRCMADTFAARHIIAIEAKVSQWAAALSQAFLNTWFASESYVLLPRTTAGMETAAERFGVQLCSPNSTITCRRPAVSDTLPRSYASWLFNEWAWRSAALS